MDKTQRWLTDEVNKKPGINTDYSYVSKVLKGVGGTGPIKKAICEILGLRC